MRRVSKAQIIWGGNYFSDMLPPSKGFICWDKRVYDQMTNDFSEGYSLLSAIYLCDDHGLQFDAINDNLQELKDKYHNNPRKVYADIYIDDHNALINELLAGGAP